MRFEKVYEDEQILIVEKPTGLVVNRSETTREVTLQDQLSSYFNLGSSLGIGDRAGIVHRLDRETSGLLIVAKREKYFDFLQGEFKQRKVKKEYIAMVHGPIKDDRGVIFGKIGRIGKFGKFGLVKEGRESKTVYEVIKRYKFDENKFDEIIYSSSFTKVRINYLKSHAKEYTLLKIRPLSGRTHQIRVHLKSIGNPVVSDLIYTPAKLLKFDLFWCPRLFLHGSRLEFKIQKSRKALKFHSGLPKDLKSAMLNLLEIRS